jgi:CRP-like cAMP-binding protein
MNVSAADLAQLFPLDALRPQALEHLAAAAAVTDYQRDELLFHVGGLDEELLYLLQGELRCDYPDGRVLHQVAGSRAAAYPLTDAVPRRFTASVVSDSARVLQLDRRFVEKVTTWEQISRDPGSRFNDAGPDGNEWVYRLLGSPAFRRLPTGNLERMLEQLERVEVAAGQVIMHEGDALDRFYVIGAGAASVSKQLDGAEQLVAYLGEGDFFGEDALLANAPRNATVRMLQNGYLMALSQEAFNAVLKPPLVSWVLPVQAARLVQEGARLLDVRMPDEFAQRAIQGAINLPLYRLREEIHGLFGTGSHVLVYCNTGERSAAAAFILSTLGYRVDAMHGGLGAMLRLQASTSTTA